MPQQSKCVREESLTPVLHHRPVEAIAVAAHPSHCAVLRFDLLDLGEENLIVVAARVEGLQGREIAHVANKRRIICIRGICSGHQLKSAATGMPHFARACA